MRVHVFQHVPFEGLGSIADWLAARDAQVHFTHFHEDGVLPALADVDLLIVLGGPMSVHDEAALPWLREEKAFIAAAIAAGTPVLGICLGAQLIASALGSRVYPALEKEIGWFDIVARPPLAHEADLLQLPPRLRVFHWHGETFALPEGAVRLAGSSACANQVFQHGRRVLAFQCHLETTPTSAAAIVTACAGELDAARTGRFVQDADTILQEETASYAAMNAVMGHVLEYLVRP